METGRWTLPSSSANDDEERRIKKEKALKGIKKVLVMSQKFSAFCEKKFSHLLENREGECLQNLLKSRENPTVAKTDEDILNELKYFKGQLRHYQIDGLLWLKTLCEHGVNGILADEMGLGKTVQVIALIAHLYQKKMSGPFIIIVPLSTLPNWGTEFKRFAPKLPVITFYGTKEQRDVLKKDLKRVFTLDGNTVKPIVITTTHMVQAELNTFARIDWKYLVVDEAHKLKNHKSIVAQEMRQLKCSNKLLLTGTPLQNNLDELWSLLNFILPLIFKDVNSFSSLLILQDLADDVKVIQEEEVNKIFSTLHKLLAPFMLRRLKSEVLNDIVPKKEVLIYCPLTKLQKKLYTYVLERNINGLYNKAEEEEIDINQPRKKRKCTENKMEKLVELDDSDTEYCGIRVTSLEQPMEMFRKIVDHPFLVQFPSTADRKHLIIDERVISESGKMMVLNSLLIKLKQGKHKVLIFSIMTMMLDLIQDYVEMENYTFCRLDGNTHLEDREKLINEFNGNPDIFLFLISTRAGGLGLNLTAADTVIFYDRDWNPQVDIQAQDRCHRIGQTKPVMIYSLVTQNTIDEKVVERGHMKRRLEKVVIQDGRLRNIKQQNYKLDIKELQEMLLVDKSESVICQGNIYSDEELDKLLDRSELYKKMEVARASQENKENHSSNE